MHLVLRTDTGRLTAGSAELDAGAGNEFRDARVSCIAGPCPFTRIDPNGLAGGGRTITASAIDWSDTATFLLEAEVFHTEIVSNVRELYPVVFGRTLSFTLPPTAEGVSLRSRARWRSDGFSARSRPLPELGELRHESRLRRRKIHRLPVRAQARLQVLIVCKEDNLVSR